MWNLLQIELFKISKRPRTYIAFIAIAAIVFIFQFAFGDVQHDKSQKRSALLLSIYPTMDEVTKNCLNHFPENDLTDYL